MRIQTPHDFYDTFLNKEGVQEIRIIDRDTGSLFDPNTLRDIADVIMRRSRKAIMKGRGNEIKEAINERIREEKVLNRYGSSGTETTMELTGKYRTQEQNNVDLTQYTIPEIYCDKVNENIKKYLIKGKKIGSNNILYNGIRNTNILEDFRNKHLQLQQDTKTYFSTPNENVRQNIETLINNASKAKSEVALIQLLYSHNQGVVIGELHLSTASKFFIKNNIQALKEQGVTTLYFEHLFFDLHQKSLQDYFSSLANTMPEILENHLEILSKGHGNLNPDNNFLTLVKAAHQAGIQIIPLDCAASYFQKNISTSLEMGDDISTRIPMMNYVAHNVIQQHQATHPGKWIALVGSAHMNNYADTPGLAELTGTFGLEIRSSSPGKKSRIIKDSGHMDGKVFFKSDLIYEMNTDKIDKVKYPSRPIYI